MKVKQRARTRKDNEKASEDQSQMELESRMGGCEVLHCQHVRISSEQALIREKWTDFHSMSTKATVSELEQKSGKDVNNPGQRELT